MLKYVAAAQALRAFSATDGTRRLYRSLANRVGGKNRGAAMRPGYITRAERNLRVSEDCGTIHDGMHAVELGTGWVHWEAFYTRLFYDVQFTLFDVWDNRQFVGFLNYARQLRLRLRDEVDRPEADLVKAEALIDQALSMKSFEDFYRWLGWRYVIEPTGSLRDIEDSSIDLIISSDVLEHVDAGAVKGLTHDMYRILRQGGAASQQIVEGDHLCIYDRAVHPKNYIRYTDRQWRWFFENQVQYVNRIQHSEWVQLFRSGGFEIVADRITERADLAGIRVSPRFAGYSDDDLAGTVSSILIRKP